MFPLAEIEKLLHDQIPSAPTEGPFDSYEITGEPFFDGDNGFVTPTLRFCPFEIYKEDDKYWRGIYFALKKDNSCSCKMMIYGGTIEKLRRITVDEFVRRIEGATGKMLQSLAKVE